MHAGDSLPRNRFGISGQSYLKVNFLKDIIDVLKFLINFSICVRNVSFCTLFQIVYSSIDSTAGMAYLKYIHSMSFEAPFA